MISSAMILAAGKGTRLKPLTLTTPKPLVKVGGHALIDWHLYALKAANITEVVVNASWLADQLVAHLENHDSGLSIQVSVEEGEPLETAGGVVKALPLISSERFLLINGDAWCDLDLAQFGVRAQQQRAQSYLGLCANPGHNPMGDFRLSNEEQLGSLVTTRGAEPGLTFSGISVQDKRTFEKLAPGVRPLAPLLREHIEAERCFGEKLSANWVDVGTVERLEALNNKISQGFAANHPAFAGLSER